MKDNTKNKIVVVTFLVILIGLFVGNILFKDKETSFYERRKLKQLTDIEITNLSDDFEKYALDQFIGRDFIRQIKYYFNDLVLHQKDNNKVFIKDNSIYKMEYPIKKENVLASANKINSIVDKYLVNNNRIFYSIIPDKNYYIKDTHLRFDYKLAEEIMNNNLNDLTYINLFDTLSINDYYRTDLHWKQENLNKVISKIEKEMNLEDTSNIKYTKNYLNDFYGAYYGQVGKRLKPDTITYLTNEIIDNTTTYNYETKEFGKVYDLTKANISPDKYDLFISGATPLITLENKNIKNNKELLLFRDSFGSSLAPLLLNNYSKITLIDIRYISSDLLDEYIEFKDQDVLFLYNVIILNQNIFK